VDKQRAFSLRQSQFYDLALAVLCDRSAHHFPLESSLGLYRSQTCPTNWTVRTLPLNVLLWFVQDILELGDKVYPFSASALFSSESTFTSYCHSRCLNGALNGNIGVMKSITAEMTDSTNVARAWAFLPLAWSSGTTLGCVPRSFRFLYVLTQS
jgi:hypothetical protein